MSRILARLAAFNFFVLLLTFAVGWLSRWRGSLTNGDDPTYMIHLYLGLLAVILTLGVHCLIFTYFLGTGRWVKEVALAYRLPDAAAALDARLEAAHLSGGTSGHAGADRHGRGRRRRAAPRV